jgi:glycosyltransferase involved in cell wall biosynthesis
MPLLPGGVSVIIPACNSAGSLAEAIDSVLSQELVPMEVIVVNDGSTDATGEVAGSYGERIVYMEQHNLGQGAARNAGLRIARGEFIAFLDADDYWRLAFLRTCVGLLQSHPEVIAVSTGLITKMLDGSEVVHPKPFCTDERRWGELLLLGNFFDFWARYDHVRTGSSVIRHSVIRQAGLQRADLRVSQDLEYWGYLATFGKWGFTPRPLWVGNSRRAARQQGWLAKYEQRRRLCPDIEQWGSRIEPRLRPCERQGYAQVRGRVALVYAQNKILAGARDSAYEVVRRYGSTMPRCWMTGILRSAVPLGRLGWFLACNTICLKERAKAVRLRWGWLS